MEFGLSLVAIIAITGGLIAFIGDKLGTKIGKKRIRIFGMRPKNSSIVVTVLTGIFIAAGTIGVSSLLSNNVRTALFGMEKLNAQMASLSTEINLKNMELEKGKSLLSQKSKELVKLNAEVDDVRTALNEQEVQKQIIEGKLISVENAYKKAEKKLESSQHDIDTLEATRKELNGYIKILETTKENLEKNIVEVREGNVVFRNGEVLTAAIVNPGLTKEEYNLVISSFLRDTNGLILKRYGDEKSAHKVMIYVRPENITAIVNQLATSGNEKKLVRVIAAGNIIFGEPVVAILQLEDYQLIYAKNKVVYREQITSGSTPESVLFSFLEKVNHTAKDKGVLPNPITGQVGVIEGQEVYHLIAEIKNTSYPFTLEAYTKEDIYSVGPLSIHIRLIPSK